MRRHFCEHILDDFFYHNKPLLYTDIVKDRGFLCQLLTQLYSDLNTTNNNLDSKLELVTTGFLPLTAATINPNNYTNFTFNPSLPSGYILVGACLKDTNALTGKVVPVYCNASSSNGTHRIDFRLANISDDPVSITESMGVAFYLFVRKR